MVLSVVGVHLPPDIPILGKELDPYLSLKRDDDGYVIIAIDDVDQANPIDGHFLKYKWYRILSDKKVCRVHPSEKATVHCIECVKAKIPVVNSYHCSGECFRNAWEHHRDLHAIARNTSTDSTSSQSNTGTSASNPIATNGTDEKCIEVGRSMTYTPTIYDIGLVLKFECVVVDSERELAVGSATTLLTSPVILRPPPTTRDLINVNGTSGQLSRIGIFTVLSYNILSDAQSTSGLYSYCPPGALSWTYRRHNLLSEVVGYRADVVCLQEVQNNHFQEFFAPELRKHGYQALFESKTSEVCSGNVIKTGCATFFLGDRFSHVKKYEGNRTNNVLSGFVKDNVALVAVLEDKLINQLVCVTNTNVNVTETTMNVELWLVYALLHGLEKIIAGQHIPVILCGHFNSVPGSAPYAYITKGKVDPHDPALAENPFGILQPAAKLTHQLRLVSAYGSSYRRGVVVPKHDDKRSLDPHTDEPQFTHCRKDFCGTHDYIFYSDESLLLESLLKLLHEKHLPIPSPEWSSSHVAIMAQFSCWPKLADRGSGMAQRKSKARCF